MPEAYPDIDHLDFEPGPLLCGCVGCPAVPHTTADPPCEGVALYRVEVHAVNGCSGRPDLTPDGGLVQLVCSRCDAARLERATGYSQRLRGFYEHYGRPVACTTCGRPLVEVEDFMSASRIP
jgi:hypothetical protein